MDDLSSFALEREKYAVVAQMEYDVQRCTRECSATGRELEPGEEYFSVLVAENGELRRIDYAAEAWSSPPEGTVGWWKARLPQRNASKKHWAPNDVMLDFWDQLADDPDKQDMRYVLTLLLVRRGVFKLAEEWNSPGPSEVLTVRCPCRDAAYEVPAVALDAERVEPIQDELSLLLQ